MISEKKLYEQYPFRLFQIDKSIEPYIEFVLEEKKLINILFFKFYLYKEIGRFTQHKFINEKKNNILLQGINSELFYYWVIIEYIRGKNK